MSSLTSRLSECPACTKKISVIASVCPYCRSKITRYKEKGIMHDEDVPKSTKRVLSWVPLISAVGVVVYFVVHGVGRNLEEWLIIVGAAIAAYIFVYWFFRASFTRNKVDLD